MFDLASDKEIGRYLKKCVNQLFENQRQFSKAYVEAEGKEANDENISREANRQCQMLNGNRPVQIHDLPIYTRILGVSCEEILSAGKCHVPATSHVTNYLIAHSENENEWENYVHQEEDLILNADEYGKTVIDYALEFENCKFLKYLINKGYIWFVGTDSMEYGYGFSAGTSIKQHDSQKRNMNILDPQLCEEQLRAKMITLAIKKDDLEMMEKLHARETPSLYQACCFSCTVLRDEDRDCCDEELIDAIAHASEAVLDYFSQEFEIEDRYHQVNRYLFPHTEELLTLLIRNRSKNAEKLLKNTIDHNRYAYDTICRLVDDTMTFYTEKHNYCEPDKKQIFKRIMKEVSFNKSESFVSYRDTAQRCGMLTNIFSLNVKSESREITLLIDELNDLHKKIRGLKYEAENGEIQQ